MRFPHHLSLAGSQEVAKGNPPLVGRKSVLLGMLASGFVVANAAESSAALATSVKPAPIAATQPAYMMRWTAITAYVRGQQVVSPNNDVVSAISSHTSSSDFATDTAKWALSSTYASVLTLTAGSADQSAAINAWLAAPAPAGVKRLVGVANISSVLNVPANTNLDGSAATITQTSANTSTLYLASGCTVRGLTLVGKGTDYVSNTSATAHYGMKATGTNVRIAGCTFSNFAWPAIYVNACVGLDIEDCTMTGIGLGTGKIVAGDGDPCYGVYVNGGGTSSRIRMDSCRINETGIGYISGDNVPMQSLTNNQVWNIRGQHAWYIQDTNSLRFVGNHTGVTCAQGLKIQLNSSTTADQLGAAIVGNTFGSCGDKGIEIAFDSAYTPTYKYRGITITGNTATNCPRGFYFGSLRNFTISGNVVDTTSAGAGITMVDCSDGEVDLGSMSNLFSEGLYCPALTNGVFDRVRFRGGSVRNPCQDPAGNYEHGITFAPGSGTGVDITWDGLDITCTGIRMTHGIYITDGASDQTTMKFRNLKTRGTGSYVGGVRLIPGTAVGEWVNNDVPGVCTNYPLTIPTRIGGRGPVTLFAATVVPSAGTFKVGDECVKLAPTVGSPKGWLCTVAGTPGTWVSTGNL